MQETLLEKIPLTLVICCVIHSRLLDISCDYMAALEVVLPHMMFLFSRIADRGG